MADALIAPDGTAYVICTRSWGDLLSCREPLVLRSDDAGLTFNAVGGGCCAIRFAYSASASGILHVGGVDYIPGPWFQFPWYSRSADRGATWSPQARFDSLQYQGEPAIAIDARDQVVGMAWTRPHDANRLVFSASSDEGLSFDPPVQVNDAGGTDEVSLAIAGNRDACLIWKQNGQVCFDRGVVNLLSEVAPVRTESIRARPNPASDAMELEWSAAGGPGRSLDTINIFNAAGRRVVSLRGDPMNGGLFRARWNESDARHCRVPAGVYFARIRGAEDTAAVEKVIVR